MKITWEFSIFFIHNMVWIFPQIKLEYCFTREKETQQKQSISMSVNDSGGIVYKIKNSYQGFETTEIRYFICLLLAVIISCGSYMT